MSEKEPWRIPPLILFPLLLCACGAAITLVAFQSSGQKLYHVYSALINALLPPAEKQPQIGLSLEDGTLEAFTYQGVQIAKIEAPSAGYAAGLRVNDVIFRVGNFMTSNREILRLAFDRILPNSGVDVCFLRGEDYMLTSMGRGTPGIVGANDVKVSLTSNQGARVSEVVFASPSAYVGIRKKDLVIAIDGIATPSAEALRQAIATKSAGDEILLTLIRNNRPDIFRVRAARHIDVIPPDPSLITLIPSAASLTMAILSLADKIDSPESLQEHILTWLLALLALTWLSSLWERSPWLVVRDFVVLSAFFFMMKACVLLESFWLSFILVITVTIYLAWKILHGIRVGAPKKDGKVNRRGLWMLALAFTSSIVMLIGHLEPLPFARPLHQSELFSSVFNIRIGLSVLFFIYFILVTLGAAIINFFSDPEAIAAAKQPLFRVENPSIGLLSTGLILLLHVPVAVGRGVIMMLEDALSTFVGLLRHKEFWIRAIFYVLPSLCGVITICAICESVSPHLIALLTTSSASESHLATEFHSLKLCSLYAIAAILVISALASLVDKHYDIATRSARMFEYYFGRVLTFSTCCFVAGGIFHFLSSKILVRGFDHFGAFFLSYGGSALLVIVFLLFARVFGYNTVSKRM